MKGLITHERSQEVTKAFRARGFKFFSNDLEECYGGHPEWHIQDDCFHAMGRDFISLEFLGCHPECTYLTKAGIRWLVSRRQRLGYEWSEKYQVFINKQRWEKMINAAIHFRSCLSFVNSVGKGYVENPVMHRFALEIIGVAPTQIIQPWQFGDPYTKTTCLWLVNLPPLKPTQVVDKGEMLRGKNGTHAKWSHFLQPGEERKKQRSKTFPGPAQAMAEQWGSHIEQQLKISA